VVIKGSLVRIGSGAVVWRVVRFGESGDACLVRMSRSIDGTYDRARSIAGTQGFKVVDVAKLNIVEAIVWEK